MQIPVIDFASASLDVDMAEAARYFGFFLLINHPISTTSTERVFKYSDRFFNDTSMDEKMRLWSKHGGEGYIPPLQERLDHNYQDPKEALNLRQNLLFNDGNGVLDHLEEVRMLWNDGYALARRILEGLARGLGMEDDMFFCKKHSADQPSSTTLRLLHYFPTNPDQSVNNDVNMDEKTVAIRAGLHSDYGSLTLLFQNEVGGLQVLKQPENVYVDVPVIPGGVVVNIGDLFQFWTGSAYISAQHRVVVSLPRGINDDDGAETRGERYSIAMFVHPDDEAILEELDHTRSLSSTSDVAWREEERRRMRRLADHKTRLTARDYLETRLVKTH